MRIFAKAMPILVQSVSNNFDWYAEPLWTFKSVGHTCRRSRCGSGTILATRRANVSSETLHYNNVVADRGTRDDLSAEHKGVIGK